MIVDIQGADTELLLDNLAVDVVSVWWWLYHVIGEVQRLADLIPVAERLRMYVRYHGGYGAAVVALGHFNSTARMEFIPCSTVHVGGLAYFDNHEVDVHLVGPYGTSTYIDSYPVVGAELSPNDAEVVKMLAYHALHSQY